MTLKNARDLLTKKHLWLFAAVLAIFIILEAYSGLISLDYLLVQGDAAYFRQIIYNVSHHLTYQATAFPGRAGGGEATLLDPYSPLLEHSNVTSPIIYGIPYLLFPNAMTPFITSILLCLGGVMLGLHLFSKALDSPVWEQNFILLAFLSVPIINGLRMPLLRTKVYIEMLSLPLLILFIFHIWRALTEQTNPDKKTYFLRTTTLVFIGLLFMGIKEDALLVGGLVGLFSFLFYRKMIGIGFMLMGFGGYVFFKKIFFPWYWHRHVSLPTEPFDTFTQLIVHNLRNLTPENVFEHLGVFTLYTLPLLPAVVGLMTVVFYKRGLKCIKDQYIQMCLVALFCNAVPLSIFMLRDHGGRTIAMSVSLLLVSMIFLLAYIRKEKLLGLEFKTFMIGLSLVLICLLTAALGKSAARSVRYLFADHSTYNEYLKITSDLQDADSVGVCDSVENLYYYLFASRQELYPCDAVEQYKPEYVFVFKNVNNGNYLEKFTNNGGYNIETNLTNILKLKRVAK
jgi:hypothetical protein